jgi:hypothetical protein
VLRDRAPNVYARLLDVGAGEIDQAALLNGPRVAADDDLVAIACRRPVFEAVLYAAAGAESTVQIVAPARDRVLMIERCRDGRARVSDVRHSGATVEADIVVDRSVAPHRRPRAYASRCRAAAVVHLKLRRPLLLPSPLQAPRRPVVARRPVHPGGDRAALCAISHSPSLSATTTRSASR